MSPGSDRLDDLATWLREQIAAEQDRDRRIQRRARELYRAWHPSNPYTFNDQADDIRDEYLHAAELFVAQEMPAVLAQCDAHSRLVDYYERMCGLWESVSEDEKERDYRIMTQQLGDAGFILRQLAVAYQHCSGFRGEWR